MVLSVGIIFCQNNVDRFKYGFHYNINILLVEANSIEVQKSVVRLYYTAEYYRDLQTDSLGNDHSCNSICFQFYILVLNCNRLLIRSHQSRRCNLVHCFYLFSC